jgi:hypothetical protein
MLIFFKTTNLSYLNEKFHLSLDKNFNCLFTAFNRHSVLASTQSHNEILPPQDIYPIQTEEQRNKLFSKYNPDKLYIVTQKYIANPKLCQLNQNINDFVGVIKDRDPANQVLGILNKN